jgi:hypothetical protein
MISGRFLEGIVLAVGVGMEMRFGEVPALRPAQAGTLMIMRVSASASSNIYL